MEQSLKKGITRVYIKNVTHFRVRFMVQGARIDLGSHKNYQDAVKVMQDWKIKDMLRTDASIFNATDTELESDYKELVTATVKEDHTSSQLTRWNEILDSYPKPTLSSRYDLVTMTGEVIPKLVVSEYLNRHNKELLDIAPARLPVFGYELAIGDQESQSDAEPASNWMIAASEQMADSVKSFDELVAQETAQLLEDQQKGNT